MPILILKNVRINAGRVIHADDQIIRGPGLGYVYLYFDQENSLTWQAYLTY